MTPARAATRRRKAGVAVAATLLLSTLGSPCIAAAPTVAATVDDKPLATSPSPAPGMDAFLRDAAGAGKYPGVVALVWRDGRLAYRGAFGHRDIARQKPIRDDAIFRVYSMTKPIASVAVMTLVEAGRIGLDDPVARFLPAFADRMVVTGGSVDAPLLTASPTALTVRHLLTHTSGIVADGDLHPLALALLQRARVEEAVDLADVAKRLATVPLAEAPGTGFHYEGANTELLARIVEVVSGEPFAAYLQQRIFDPLAMRDTGFEVPQDQRGRVVDLATTDADGKIVLADTASARIPGSRLRPYDSAAGGLYSTADDYLRFARMLLGGGALSDVRVLSTASVQAMQRDALARYDPPLAGPAPGESFGLGVGVLVDPMARDRRGAAGQFGWPGAASTWFTVDPGQGMVAVLMAQYLPSGHAEVDLARLSTGFQHRVFDAVP